MLSSFNMHSSHLEVLVKQILVQYLGLGLRFGLPWTDSQVKSLLLVWGPHSGEAEKGGSAETSALTSGQGATQEATWKTTTRQGRGSKYPDFESLKREKPHLSQGKGFMEEVAFFKCCSTFKNKQTKKTWLQ